MKNYNEEFVKQTYAFLGHEKETEIRIINPKAEDKKKSIIATFHVKSEKDFLRVCKEYSGKYNVYVGINERIPNGTLSKEVIKVKTLCVDIDPTRTNGIKEDATTEAELKEAENIADQIINNFEKEGLVKPIKCLSGNGYQLWFAIPIITITNENRQETEDKIKLFIQTLQNKYNNDKVKIDQIGDLARIIKVMGTLSIKGNNTPERPYRLAQPINIFQRKEDNNFLEKLMQLETTTSTPELKERKVKLSTWEILKMKEPDTKQRGSLIMQLKEGNAWNEEQISEYIAKNNNWKNYDPIQTREGIKVFFKNYADKSNPRKKELNKPSYFGVMQFNPTTEINISEHLADGYIRKKESYVTITKLCYRIYTFQFGSGKNKKFFLITRPFETKNLGKQILCIRQLLFNTKEQEDGTKKEMLEKISYCFPEKPVIEFICNEANIPISEGSGKNKVYFTYEQLLEKILERHKQSELFYTETPIVPTKQLTSIKKEKWQEILEDFFNEGINKDPIITLTYKSDLIQVNPEVIKNPKYYQPKNSNELVYTNTKTSKSTNANKSSRLLLSARISKLLGFSTANEVIKGELDNETRVITIDEVQEDKGEELFGLLNNFMEQGTCEIAKGKQSVNVKGYAGLRWQGNPKLSYENQEQQEQSNLKQFEEEALHQHFVDSLKIISSNNEAFGGRIGYLVFRLDLTSKKDFKQTKELNQEQLDHNEALVKAVMQETRTNYSKLYFNQKIIDWHNKPLSNSYTNTLLDLEKNALLEAIRLFIKGHREQANSHLRGKAFKLACVDHAINIMREETNIKTLLEDAEEYVNQIQEQNLYSFKNLVKISENEEAKKNYLETAYKELPEHLKILLSAVIEAREIMPQQKYTLKELSSYFKYTTEKYYEKLVLERTTKNMGRTNSQIQKFGVQLTGDQNTCGLIVQNEGVLKYAKDQEK